MTSTVELTRETSGPGVRHLRVAVVGTGFSGLGMAIRLRQEGITDFLVFERADEIGGTWRDNSYPGSACDVMSLLYSFSFAQNPNWRTTFGKQQEVLDYLRDCAERFGLAPHIRLGHELTGAAWDDAARRWRISTSQGDFTADVLVTGTGYLSDPAVPEIDGLSTFAGPVFHSSRWDHGADLTGKRIAVVGTGASAIQFVPKIQPDAAQLHVFQRTAAWVAPKGDKEISARQLWLRRRVPGYQNFRRNFNMWGREVLAFIMNSPKRAEKVLQGMASKHLAASVADEGLRAKLTPDYTAGCKRLLFSDTWYPAITAPNVDVVTDRITRVTPTSVVTADGTEREVDVVIFGTGFQATSRPVAHLLRGRDGRTLGEAWDTGMSAYRGTTVAGFPNLFMLLGPNTTLGHSSQTVMIEAQLAYVLDAVKQLDARGAASVEVRPEAQAAWNARLDDLLTGTVWNAGNCRSWYLDASGRNPSIWPTYTFRFRRETRRFDIAAYRVATSAGVPVA
ncbi:flavin-containing monooxygenase [Spirilliplanes yamanashiensis]|uniref:Baeyer-Villiger monooxygenase n=1 Tax=Spirilliplanes yamanashiensis TaxID=42233 RepID=A0A8J4DH71_9ACTN|nr:NAD(P)/FAD-dependent oxidoreductase [Spirilliplanes yamanashiensis]MDP9819305.1 cation diffusion facilitator CzcD-associated flavoprotein CzcO [Spirilliplanes yamanashiensis]GIJ01872.1 Baeyer-Villiger monooxygenase [Spirilliplanes yamanashiensis]